MLDVIKSIAQHAIYSFHALCSFINIFLSPSKTITPNTILLIRLDAIGDYILFRNFIEILKKSDKYKNYSITLLGNVAWKSLSQELDGDFIDRFIWLNRSRFSRNILYRYKKLKEIISIGYEIVISPVYSREFYYTDYIVKLLNAKETIGSTGDLSNIKKNQKSISDKYYNKLIYAKKEILFEFDRNKEFFEKVLQTKIYFQKPYIRLNKKNKSFHILPKFALIFIGASKKFRKWNIKNFAKIGNYLKSQFNYEIVLCGSSKDISEAKDFAKGFQGEFSNFVGKTNLVDLLYIISNCDFIISNETMAPHMAVALEVKHIFVVSNGNHFGRFTPYPSEVVSNYHVIYHPEIEENLNNYIKLSNSYGYGSRLDINEISYDMVKDKIQMVLNG